VQECVSFDKRATAKLPTLDHNNDETEGEPNNTAGNNRIIRTNAIRIGPVHDLVLIGLDDFESSETTAFG
jgi:hypothetical protein